MLVQHAHGLRARLAAIVFAASVAAMFGASALYHRVNWSPARRRWMRRLDHAMIYGLIAGTYTPFGLLVLHGSWRIIVLAVVWSGAAAAVALKFAWVDAPKWLAAVIGIALGWVGVIVAPQLVHRIGASGVAFWSQAASRTRRERSSTRCDDLTRCQPCSATTRSSTPS